MSEPVTPKAPPPPPRDAVVGASEQMLRQPAGLYLASLRWDGAASDPDTLAASAFLARL